MLFLLGLGAHKSNRNVYYVLVVTVKLIEIHNIMKMAVLWFVAPCSLVGVYQHLRGASHLHHRWTQHSSEDSISFLVIVRISGLSCKELLPAECTCNLLGTDAEAGPCDRNTGQCSCRPNVIGLNCDQCKENHWKIASGMGCEACDCDPIGSGAEQCNQVSGQVRNKIFEMICLCSICVCVCMVLCTRYVLNWLNQFTVIMDLLRIIKIIAIAMEIISLEVSFKIVWSQKVTMFTKYRDINLFLKSLSSHLTVELSFLNRIIYHMHIKVGIFLSKLSIFLVSPPPPLRAITSTTTVMSL